MTNTEIAKSMYEAFGRGDIAALSNSLSGDAGGVERGLEVIRTVGQYKGRGQIAAFFQKVADSIDFDLFVIDRFVEQGDTVVTLGSYSAGAKPMQKLFHWAMIFTMSGGKVTRFEEYADTASIAEAFTSSPRAART